MKILILLAVPLSICALTLDKNPKIVGGEDAKIEEFPAIVALIRVSSASQFCAGSLISEFWILTAAHCYTDPDNFLVEHSTTKLQLLDPKSKLAVPELYIQHEKYDSDALKFDIGLIKLKEPLNTGLHVPFSKLAVPGSFYPTGTPATVAGWGRWNYGNSTLPPLQKAELELWHYRDCQKAHSSSGISLQIHSHQICAGLPDFSKAECNGDSGGPLYVNGVQVGIVSWSIKPCAVAEFPGVYTDVSFFIPWIQEQTDLDFKMQNFLVR